MSEDHTGELKESPLPSNVVPIFGRKKDKKSVSSPAGRPHPYSSHRVLKAGERESEVSAYEPKSVRKVRRNDPAFESLRKNFQSLQELQSRLRFMLKDLEEFSKD